MDKIKFLNIKFSKFFFIIKIPVVFLFPEIPCYSNIYSSELTFISNHRSRWKIRKFRVSKLDFSRWFSKISNQRKIGWKIFCQSSISRRFQEPNLEKKNFLLYYSAERIFNDSNSQKFFNPSNFQLVQPVRSVLKNIHLEEYQHASCSTKRSLEKEKKERTEVFEMIEKV